ncbi:helix-turn-helix domain-containing protein [Schlesneria paludicola]|uniref:helix-turn-helix domain-containing protein n=1 Tax=Schlesneria paludicola TaxID=360056 RepID=UPI00029A3CE0|nr:helix-turn-helix transcriptional regulator [Schlesneria paludicola]
MATLFQAEKVLSKTALQFYLEVQCALDECDPKIQEIVARMFKILRNKNAPSEAQSHAWDVIDEAIFPSRSAMIREENNAFHASPEAQTAEQELIDEERNFAETVQTLMESKGISQAQLAAQMGTTQPAVSNLLKRQSRPQRKTIKRIAEALGVNPKVLWPNFVDA